MAQESLRELSHRLGAADAFAPIPALRELWTASVEELTTRWQALGPLYQQHLSPGTLNTPGTPETIEQQLVRMESLPERFLIGSGRRRDSPGKQDGRHKGGRHSRKLQVSGPDQ